MAIQGWTETAGITAEELIGRFRSDGLTQAICTDIARDGMLCGVSTAFYAGLQRQFPEVEITVSGGIGTMAGDRGCAARACAASLSERPSTKAVSPSKRSNDACQTNNTLSGHPRRRDGKGHSLRAAAAGRRSRGVGAKYAAEGADELVYLDISATEEGRQTFTELVTRIAARIDIPFTVGGGIRSVDDAGRLLDAGADKISLNSAAVANPSLIDAIAPNTVRNSSWRRSTPGRSTDAGRDDTRRKAPHRTRLFTWAREAVDRGAGEILFTSMDHDGTKNGYPCETFARLAELPVPIIASGGAGSVAHIADVLTRGRADAALAASIFHYGEIPIPRLKRGAPGARNRRTTVKQNRKKHEIHHENRRQNPFRSSTSKSSPTGLFPPSSKTTAPSRSSCWGT